MSSRTYRWSTWRPTSPMLSGHCCGRQSSCLLMSATVVTDTGTSPWPATSCSTAPTCETRSKNSCNSLPCLIHLLRHSPHGVPVAPSELVGRLVNRLLVGARPLVQLAHHQPRLTFTVRVGL